MVINDSMLWKGQMIKLVWHDCDSFDGLPIEKCQQSYGVCFYKDKLVITKGPGGWNIVGGHIEKGETPEIALEREVQEEANMRVLKQVPIGYQEVFNPNGKTEFQLRSFCVVEPIGKFEKDPAGSVTEIKLIDPKDYKKYFDWGKIGDRIMERAIEILNSSQVTNARGFLGKEVEIVIDRPLGSKHPKHGFVYEVNYGYVPDTKSPDGEELDVYYLGVDKPLEKANGICIAVIHRINDDDDKLILVPVGMDVSDEEIEKLVEFQEKWFKHEIVR